MAIPYSYEGVVEAIKTRSGSTKFYKPSFQGIIEAILDWNGSGGGSIEILPPGTDLPTTGDEEDGDMIGIPNADGDYFIYIYADGAWQPINITTAQVLEADKKPVGATMPKFITPDGTVLETQQDYNNYIVEVIINDQIRQDEDIEELKLQGDDFAADQDRQDQELEDYKQEVSADQDRQDKALEDYKKEVKADQDRQDAEIEALKPCSITKITEVLSNSTYDPLSWVVGWTNGVEEHGIRMQESIHPSDWPRPKDEQVIYVDGKEYQVLRTVVYSGNIYAYYLPHYSLDHLVGQEVTVSLCPPDKFEEIYEDQARQDQELADYKQEVQADQDRQDEALQDEIDARAERDALHDAEIDTLEYKLDALLGLTFRGTYEFKHDADCDAAYLTCMNNAGADINAQQACTRDYASCEQNKVLPGTFEAIDPDDQFDHLEQIIIAKSDSSGVEVDWAGVLNAGDFLEVDHVLMGQLDKTNYGLYRIEEEPETTTNAHGHDVYTMKLQFLQGDGVMLEDEKYEIRGITSAEGVNPEELADFLTKDQAAATYLPLSGGTLTGTLNMKDAAAVKTRHLDSGNNSNLAIKRNGETKITVGSDSVIFNKIPSCGINPTQNDHLCRKKWIDDNKSAKGHTHSYASTNHNHDGTYSKTGHTHSGYASSSHNHDTKYVKGNYTITKSNGNYYIS